MTFAFDRDTVRRTPPNRPTAFRICLNALRKSFVAFAVLLSACAASGEEQVLWWQVGDPFDENSLSDVQITTFHEGVKTAAELGVTGARVRVEGTDVYLPMLDVGDVAVPVPTDWYASVVSPYDSEAYSFVIELGNWDMDSGTWTAIATSEAGSYADLKGKGRIDSWGSFDPQNPNTWQPVSYVIPEPSGGMLMLVGLALLALRRRRSGGE